MTTRSSPRSPHKFALRRTGTRHATASILLVSLSLFGACETRSPVERRAASASRNPARVAMGSGADERPMAQRREVQGLIDSASTLLHAGDTALALSLLHRSAAFLLVEANAPPTCGTDNLLRSADSLDHLAGQLARGEIRTSEALRHLSALLNLAEAERHAGLASVAWSTCSKKSVADELLMTADHVERASMDGRIALSVRTRSLLAEVRRLASRLDTEPGVDVQAADEPMSSLQLEIRALRRELSRAPLAPTS